MDNFVVDHPEIFLGLLGVLLAMVGFFIRMFIKKIPRLERDIQEMKENYLERFTDVKEHQATAALKTQNMIADLSVKITEVLTKQEAQAGFCKYVQEEKRNNKK